MDWQRGTNSSMRLGIIVNKTIQCRKEYEFMLTYLSFCDPMDRPTSCGMHERDPCFKTGVDNGVNLFRWFVMRQAPAFMIYKKIIIQIEELSSIPDTVNAII